MTVKLKLLVLLSGILAGGGCASHQVTPQTVRPAAVGPFQAVQVQVKFATPADSTYLADQLVEQLAQRGVNASLLPPESGAILAQDGGSALLQLRLTDSWTETFISRRTKHRRSLTQTRGRIPRESPRFRSDLVVVNRQTGEIIWQSETVTAGAWYADFKTMARSLAVKLTQQLDKQGLIAPASVAASS